MPETVFKAEEDHDIVGTKIFVFTGAKIDINPILKKEIEKAKNND